MSGVRWKLDGYEEGSYSEPLPVDPEKIMTEICAAERSIVDQLHLLLQSCIATYNGKEPAPLPGRQLGDPPRPGMWKEEI